MASVLVIAADPNIESLVGELVAFAGHRPVYDVTVGAAGEAVRRVRPDVTLLDTALDAEVVRACLKAADEVGSRPVLTSSTASPSELLEEARARGCLFFPLPGGPRPLERVIERAISERPRREVDVPSHALTTRPRGSMHPALCAALTSMARSNAVSLRTRQSGAEAVRGEKTVRDSAVGGLWGSSALRAAVTDYTRQLRAARLPLEEAITIVRDAVHDCALIVGVDAEVNAVLADSERWARLAYQAA